MLRPIHFFYLLLASTGIGLLSMFLHPAKTKQVQTQPPLPVSKELNRTFIDSTQKARHPETPRELSPKRTTVLDPEEKKALRRIISLSQERQHILALQEADKWLQTRTTSQGFSQWIRLQLHVLLLNAASGEINQSRFDSALTYLLRADALKPREAKTMEGMAYCYFKSELYGQAESMILLYKETFQKITPELARIYSELLESTERYSEAAEVLEEILTGRAAQEFPPQERAHLEKRIAAMHQRDQESLLQETLSTNHFSMIFRRKEHAEVAPALLERLTASLDDLVGRLEVPYPETMIEVILYEERTFTDLVPGIPTWAEGIFDGRIRLPIRQNSQKAELLERLDRTLRHELVHALFAKMLGNRELPPWFNEGVAEWASCQEKPCSSPVPRPQAAKVFLKAEDFLPRYTSYGSVKARIVYRQSLFLIETIVAEHGIDGLQRIIRKLSSLETIDSDSILRPLDLSFARLVRHAASRW